MSFVNILKTVLGISGAAVPAVLSIVAPGVAPLVTTVVNAALTAEAKVGAGNGAQKFQTAMEFINVAAPSLVQGIELSTGKKLSDQQAFAQGVSNMLEASVQIMNAFGVLPKPAAK